MAVKSKELRLGNYVECPNGISIVNEIRNSVSGNFIGDVINIQKTSWYNVVEENSNTIKPIPISPDILEKSYVFKTTDFIKGNQLYKINNTTGSHFVFDSDRNEYLIFATDFNGGFYAFASFKYLHHFQNLVYDLTGEELIINL